MTARVFHTAGCSELTHGSGVLTTDHSASSYGQPVFVRESDGVVLGSGEMGAGYLHRCETETYTAEQEEWIGAMIIASGCDQRPGAAPHHYRFGASWKNASQLAEIERRLAAEGGRLFRNS